MHPIFKQALAPWAPPAGPVTLASGRVVVHTREPNGAQRATPTPGGLRHDAGRMGRIQRGAP